MKKKVIDLKEALKEFQPLKQDEVGRMEGGFAPYGGADALQTIVLPTIMNSVLVGVLGYACSCSCQCTC